MMSKYLKFFEQHRERLSNESSLVGDILLVERVVFEEKKTASGLYIPDSKKVQVTGLTSEIPTFFRVLLVGKGYYDDASGKEVPVDCQPGDIILTANASVKIYSSFPVIQSTDSDVLGITRYGDVQWHWRGEEKFRQFLADLNNALN